MALPPHFAYTSLGSGPRTMEVWIDFLCPFCARASLTFESTIVPRVLPGGEWHGQIRLLFRPYPQPWHPQGGWVVDAALAFGRLYASPLKGESVSESEEKQSARSLLWFKYYVELFKRQGEFKELTILEESVRDLKTKLAKIAAEVYAKEAVKLGLADEAGVKEEDVVANMENSIIPAPEKQASLDIRYFTKLGRQNGIHVTPSVVVDGLFDAGPQSSWTVDQWTEWFAKQGIVSKL